jgi:hypothetical protein
MSMMPVRWAAIVRAAMVAMLLLLLLLLVLLPAHTDCEGDAQFAVPIVTGVSHRSFAVEGPSAQLQHGSGLLVEGFGLSATYAGAPPPACRISPRGGESAFVHVSGYIDDPRSVIEFPATVVSGAHQSCSPPCYVAPNNRSCCHSVLRCDPPPAVLAPGPGTLSVRNNVGWSLEPQPVEYAFLIDVALDRRPYIAEAQGALLLRCNASLVGTAGVTVAATIPTLPAAATASWRWANVQLNSSTVLRFDLSSLPPTTVNADIEIVISGGGGGLNITKHRRFMRAPPPSAAGEVQAAQIDHATRGLLVGGDPFGLGTGWYIDGNEERLWKGNISAYAAAMERQASLGDNWVLPYGLSSRFTPSEQRWFLDRCAEQRVKVMMPLAPSIGGARDKDYDPWIRDPAWLDWVRTNVFF